MLDLRSESVVSGEQPGVALVTGKTHARAPSGAQLRHPSIHTHKVGYRKDKSSTQQKPVQALVMLRSKLEPSQKAKPKSSCQNQVQR